MELVPSVGPGGYACGLKGDIALYSPNQARHLTVLSSSFNMVLSFPPRPDIACSCQPGSLPAGNPRLIMQQVRNRLPPLVCCHFIASRQFLACLSWMVDGLVGQAGKAYIMA